MMLWFGLDLGRPNDAKEHMRVHRENCSICKPVNYVNIVELWGRCRVRRELVLPKEHEAITINLLILRAGIIPPGHMVRQMIYDRELQDDEKCPGEFARLPEW